MDNIGNINIDKEKMRLRSNKNIYCESYYFIDVYDETEIKQFIKSVEKIVRGSKYYKKYIELLRTNIHALNYDSINSNISQNEADLEFHHYPLSLYDNIQVLVLDHIIKKDNITTFSIAKEIMQEHFNHKIGLVPLHKTNHELAHSGSIFIHKKQIFGDYQAFVDSHIDAVTVELKEKIKRMEQMSDQNIATDFKGIL